MDSASKHHLKSTPQGVDSAVRIPPIIGNYCIVLGWLSLTWIVLASVFWGGALRIDFIVWFLLGSALKKRVFAARLWAIGISVFAVSILLLLIFVQGGKATFGSLTYDRGQPGYYVIFAFLVSFSLPGILLLTPQGARAFRKQPNAEQTTEAD